MDIVARPVIDPEFFSKGKKKKTVGLSTFLMRELLLNKISDIQESALKQQWWRVFLPSIFFKLPSIFVMHARRVVISMMQGGEHFFFFFSLTLTV